MLRPAEFSTDTIPVNTTAGLYHPIAPLLELDVSEYSTLYFTIQNGSTEVNDVNITISHGVGDFNSICTFQLNPEEVVSIPVPTGNGRTCTIVSSEKAYLLRVAYEAAISPSEGFYPYEVVYSSSVTKHYDTTAVSVGMVAGSSIHILPKQEAMTYILNLTTNRPVYLLRGRVKYYLSGQIKMLINGKYMADIYLTSEQVTSLRFSLTAAKKIEPVGSNLSFVLHV